MAPQKGFIPINKKIIDLDSMINLYYKDKLNYKEIANHFGFKSKSAIYDRFKKLGLVARTNTELKTGFKHSNNTKTKISKSLCKKRKSYIYRGYRMIRVGNKFLPEHRVLWERINGKIPKGYEIHHINFNKLDNNINNLRCISKSEHTILHNLLR